MPPPPPISLLCPPHFANCHDLTFLLGITRGGSRIFERGGGVQARIQDFSSTPPPLDIVRVTSSALRKLKKTPALGHIHKHPPPPLDIARVTSSTPQDPPLHLRSTSKKGGSNFGPNVKKPTSWPKGGGGGPDPLDPPPCIRH